jgi:RNA polymerase sigma factor (sigma-70 family)
MKVLSDYAPLVKSRAMYFVTYGFELDDLIQEGNIGLFTATLKYDSSLSAFSTFARKCIDAAIIDSLRRSQKLSKIPEKCLVDIAEVDVPDTAPEVEHYVAVKEEYTQMLNKADSVLSDFEYSVFQLKKTGYKNADISEILKCGVKSIENANNRIKIKIKETKNHIKKQEQL